MKAQLIDGKKLQQQVLSQLAAHASPEITLAVVLVGDDAASAVYVKNKVEACLRLGIRSVAKMLPASTTQEQLEQVVTQLNADDTVHGILVQLPLPKAIDERRILTLIDPEKDVDGFSPISVGRLNLGQDCFVPCTAGGVVTLIQSTKTTIAGKHVVVVGRSSIVGKPLASLLLGMDATVTVCHSKTPDLAYFTRQADILVVAVGRAGLVGGDMIKPGAVVIDVGINRTPNGLRGDVDFESAAEVASFITPVPGGVGPMTIATLLQNTVKAYRKTVKQPCEL